MTTSKFVICFSLALTVASAFSQETYKCNVGGSWVYQDRPCSGAVRRSADMAVAKPTTTTATVPSAPPAAAPAESSKMDTAQRLERDKAWLDERAKKREREEAMDRVRFCEADAHAIQAQIDHITSTSGPSYVPNLVGVATMQLDEERRQTQISGLSARATAKRAECDQLRQAYDRKYLKPG